MKRHIVDHQNLSSKARLRRYLRLSKRAAVHPSVHALHRRARFGAGARRMSAYLRIARGQTV